ncbi:MAG TPA: hypothetical protein DER33_08265 [Syntrophomonas sp.]|nr:hypothetical protein [Syntrophomonas sp.]HCF71559.1 hypothetical protein [Syntrophomonas sp.]
MLIHDSKIMHEMEKIKPGAHVCLLYENEEEWQNSVIPFLATGINGNEVCVCVVKEHTVQQIRQYLDEAYKDLPSPQIDQQLIILQSEDIPPSDYSADINKLIQYIIDAAYKAKQDGFKGLRFTAEIDWMVGTGENSFENMLEYENSLTSDLSLNFPITVLSRCYIDKFSIAAIKEIVMTHAFYIRKDKFYRNYRHILPGKTKKQNRAKLDKWFIDLEKEQDNYCHIQFLANILEHSSQPFCTNSPKGRVISFNNAFCNMLGYDRAEIAQLKSLKDLTPCEWHGIIDYATDRLSRTGKPQRYEMEIQSKNGNTIPVSVLIDGIKDKKGNVSYYSSFFTDITERKRSEQILQEREERYRVLFNTINEGWSLFEIIADQDNYPCDFRFCEINPGFERQTGLSKENVISHTLLEVLPDMDSEWLNIFIQAALDKKPVSFQRYSPTLKRYFEASVFVTTEKYLAVMTIDITRLKHLEARLQEQLHFLQHLIDNIPNPVFYKDLNGVYQGCNRAFENIMGRPGNEIIGRTFFDIAPYEIAANGWKMDQQLFANQELQHYDSILPYADGSLHDVIYNKAPVFSMNHKLTGLVGVTVDITERKRAEQALAISEENFRSIFSQSPIGIAVVNCNGVVVEANPACLDIFGVNTLNDLDRFQLFEDPTLPYEAKQKLIQGEVVRYEAEFNFDIIREQGIYNTRKSEYAYLDYLITPLISHEGGTGGYLVQVQDVTEQRKSALALRNNETQLRRITSTMRDIICQTDLIGIVQYISSSVRTVLGYEAEEMIGKNIWCYTHPDDMGRVLEINRRALSKGSYGKIEFRYRKKNGPYLWLEAVGNPLWDEEGSMVGIVLGTRDITERKHMEKEMARLDRLRLAGEMAATIGHEIRNPMTTVHGFLQLLKSEPECSSFQSYFDLMIEELNATNSIITEFLSLAQNKAIYLKVQNLNCIVKNIYPLISAEAIKSDKQVTLELGNIPDTGIDSNEIRQLILNLALNGLDAMEPGGTLQISTFLKNNEIVLAIKDQGKGIDPAIFDKLGTPFVTTKENGTGLGLAVCYSIADRHNATIDYQTGPNGTTFMAIFKPA